MKETRLQDTPTPGRKNNQEDNAMKKTMKYTLAALISISAALSCTKEMSEPAAPGKLVYKVFGATSEQEKTSIDFTTPAILWSAGDELGVVADPTSKADGAKKLSMLSEPGLSTASFGGEITEASGNYFFTYPYIEGLTDVKVKEANKSVSITTVLPSVQKVGPEEIYNGALITAGHCAAGETSVTMHPIGIFLKLGISGSDIASVKVYANSSSIISGSLSATYNMKNPASSYLNPRTAAEMSNAITLLPKSGTSLSEGNYYLCSRKGYKGSNGDVNGMTIKFTKTDGTATYLSQDDEPAAAEDMDAANQTIDLGAFNSASLNWKKQTVVEVILGDGSAAVQPFTTDIPTSGAVDADYSLPDGLSFHIKSATGGLKQSGLAMETSGDYIELPALPGKKLKEVEIYTSGGYEGTITDLDGKIVAGASRRLYAGITYTYIIPHSSANTRYRILTNPKEDKCKNITGIKLYYSGNDSDIYVTTGTASLEGKTVTVTGNTIIAGDVALTDITCGLETSRDGYTWEQATSAAASASFDASTEVWQGVTYIRAWARVEGQKKAYGEVKQVATPTITLDFDFSTQAIVEANVAVVSTTDSAHPLTALPLADRNMTGEDTYTYKFSDYAVTNFSVISHWVATNPEGSKRTQMTYRIFSSTGLRCTTAANSSGKHYYMSLPTIPGYKLTSVENWCTQNKRKMGIVDAPTQDDGETILKTTNGSETLDDGFYKSTLDVSAKSVANTQYYARFYSNGYNPHIICHYEKVTEASPSFANVVFSEVNL